jgi:hypothetical protein
MGRIPGEAKQDEEGIAGARYLNPRALVVVNRSEFSGDRFPHGSAKVVAPRKVGEAPGTTGPPGGEGNHEREAAVNDAWGPRRSEATGRPNADGRAPHVGRARGMKTDDLGCAVGDG